MPLPNTGADRHGDHEPDAKEKRTAHEASLQRNDYVAL
jgi:hypothetical protein